MGESIAFLCTLAGTVYFLYWFWKNDDRLADWTKKPHDFNKRDGD